MTDTASSVVVSATPPADTRCLWLSTSHKDMLISQDPADRTTIIRPELSWEGTAVQEPTVWHSNSRWNMFYSAGSSANVVLGYASATHPEGPWTKHATPLLGHSYGSDYALDLFHANIYIESGVGYLYFPDVATKGRWLVATFDPANPTAGFTISATPVFTVPTHGTPAATQGNSFVFKDTDGTYIFIYEANYSNFQNGVATGSSPTGPFTNVALPVSTLRPPFNAANAASFAIQHGGPWLVKEGATYILYFHGGPNGRPTAGYRAFSTDLLNWTIDRDGRPFIRRVGPFEVDQIADLCVVANPGGSGAAMFFDQMQNEPTLVGYIAYSPMRPVLKMWDGNHWVPALSTPDVTLNQFEDPVNSLTSDFTTTTVGSDVTVANATNGTANTLGMIFTPTGNRKATIRCRMDVSSSAAGSVIAKMSVSPTTFTGAVPYVTSVTPSARRDDMPADAAKFTTLTFWLTCYLISGTTYTFTTTVNNSAVGATTTVKSGSYVEMDTKPN